MTNQMTNPDCGQCEQKEMGVGWGATKRGKSEQGFEEGKFWIAREKRECISGQCEAGGWSEG